MSYVPQLDATVVSVGNTTTVPLAASASFVGATEDVMGYVEASINVYGVPSTADGTLVLEFSPDGTNFDVSTDLDLSDLSAFVPFPLRMILPYFRVRYINGGTPQTVFRLTTLYHTRAAKPLTRILGEITGTSDPVDIVRALVEPSVQSRHSLLSADRTLFGRAATAVRTTQVRTKSDLSISNNPVTTAVSGGGAVTQSAGQITLSTSTAATANARMRTRRNLEHFPGRELYAVFTAAFTVPTSANSRQIAGVWDFVNGFIFGYSGTTFGIIIRSNSVDTLIPRASWNGDSFDGSAASKFTRDEEPEAINFAKYNLYRIRFGWMGPAVVIFEIMAPDGQWVVAHKVLDLNLTTVPTILAPTVPLQMEVDKAAADATNLVITTGSWDGGSVSDRPFISDFEAFTGVAATGNGPAIDISYLEPLDKYCLQVEAVGGVAPTWDVRLDVDLLSSFTAGLDVLSHTTADGSSAIKVVDARPARFMRYRVASITGGGTLTIRIMGTK